MYNQIIDFIRTLYPGNDPIALHAPVFPGNEKKYVLQCIDSTFVSSIGEYVSNFEKIICNYTGSKYAIAANSGTSALHIALIIAGVDRNSEVLCQDLTFVATANAISYTGAQPVFLDSAVNNLGMCPEDLELFLSDNVEIKEKCSFNKKTKKRISACVPMHVFGHPIDMDAIKKICHQYHIPVVEDAAESLGSYYKGRHTGTLGDIGILSFNGNKIVTCGGGGMILTDNEAWAKRAKHLTTTAKKPHAWAFYHDEIGYNYRLPNLNAAMACAQMESLPFFLENKKKTAQEYRNFFTKLSVQFIEQPTHSQSNFWLNAIQLESKAQQTELLEKTNQAGISTRPIWTLMTDLPAYSSCQKTHLKNARIYADTIINLPSGVRINK